MSPNEKGCSELTLTTQQIDEWPDTEKTIVLEWPTGHSASFSVPALEQGIPICRRLARLWLDFERIHDEDTRDSVLLVVSELMTNALKHSRSSRITGRLWKSGSALFVEVRDEGGTSSVPRMRCAGIDDEDGRGISLVTRSARGWGKQLDPDGSCAVWVTVPMPTSV